MSYKVLKSIKLRKSHQATGSVKHYFGNEELAKPSQLQIVKIGGDPGFYLLYFDSNGDELTDTYHETETDALEQAEREFSVKPFEWTDDSE